MFNQSSSSNVKSGALAMPITRLSAIGLRSLYRVSVTMRDSRYIPYNADGVASVRLWNASKRRAKFIQSMRDSLIGYSLFSV